METIVFWAWLEIETNTINSEAEGGNIYMEVKSVTRPWQGTGVLQCTKPGQLECLSFIFYDEARRLAEDRIASRLNTGIWCCAT